jgi:biotin carboxylase
MSVIIVEPLSSGEALVEAARRMGQDALVFTADQGERQHSAACRKWATSVIVVDTYDADAVFHAAQGVSREGKLETIIPGFEYCVDVVAKAASGLGLPHLSVAAATSARNKFACREQLKAAGIDVPRYALMHNQSEVERAAFEVGFPAVIKPADGGGSCLVRRVDSLDELRGVVGNFATGLLDVDHYVGAPFLLEEFLAGREFSIEGYVDRGQPHVAAVTEKQLGAAPFFVEMGHVVEAALPADEREALVTYVEQVALAIELGLGVFHAEARMTERGPVLIEINCRLGGDRIPRLVELTQGLSLPATMIRSYCGWENPASVDPLCDRRGVAGVRFLTFDSVARFGTANGVDEVRAMTGCEEVELYFHAGDAVPQLTDFRGRVGHVLFTADDRPTLDMRLREAENRIRFLPQAAYALASIV